MIGENFKRIKRETPYKKTIEHLRDLNAYLWDTYTKCLDAGIKWEDRPIDFAAEIERIWWTIENLNYAKECGINNFTFKPFYKAEKLFKEGWTPIND